MTQRASGSAASAIRMLGYSLLLLGALLSSCGCSALSTPNSTTKPIPITVLSGFLGTGKTTLLQTMLQNKQGLRIGVVVNDVASVNIDSKLVAQGNAGSLQAADGMVELQNGCACCSLSDELLGSVANLVTLSDLKCQSDTESGFDHIVIELSGVADPKAIRAKFQEASMAEMPLMERVQLDTLVSLVDCSTFESHFTSVALATRDEMPELFTSVADSDEEEEWMKDLPPKLRDVVLQSLRGQQEGEPESVADLLTSQTETADLVVLNKQDLVSSSELARLRDIVAALNPRAKVLATTYGQVDLDQVLGIAKGLGVAVAGAVDDHRDYVEAAISHSHSHDHDAATCTDPSHSHDHEHSSSTATAASSHDHSHEHSAAAACEDPGCTDPSHSHSHEHAKAEEACTDPVCTDPSHSHEHSHSHTEACDDPTCNDPSHSHSHSHDHVKQDPATYVGIGSFVYRARRPFHPGRLVSFLRYLPVKRGIPEDSSAMTLKVPANTQAVLQQCLRSKGFVWSAHSHTDALYWSHAGSTFELSCLGQWWATLPRSQWPPGVDEYVLRDFDDPAHDDATNNVGVGDRRQEVVFIGPTLGDALSQTRVTESLDQCLLTDEEWEEYQKLSPGQSLATRFPSSLESKYVAY